MCGVANRLDSVSAAMALMMVPKTAFLPTSSAKPPKPPVALNIEAAAACCNPSPKALLVAVVVVFPFTVVVVRDNCSAPTAPAMVKMLGVALV